jgi:nicotinate-nucleotide pyrophosphorylase (carboxylating)
VSALDPPQHLVREAVARALAEDVGALGDLTAALVPADARAVGVVVARVPGVLAGRACAAETWAQLDPAVQLAWRCADGDELRAGTVVADVTGPLRSVLTGERTALNFLCHLSGVATLTRRFAVAAGAHTRVLDTRKTLPGLRALEKAAVRAGGGVNHRGSLSDLVLVKDNHRAGLTVGEAVAAAHAAWPGRGVEVECDDADEVRDAVGAGADLVLLDNFSPEQVAACVPIVRAGPRPETPVEVSGGVTLDTVAAYAASGADLVSVGALTQSAPALDLALDLDPGSR